MPIYMKQGGVVVSQPVVLEIELTPAQVLMVQRYTGKAVTKIELTAEELNLVVAYGKHFPKAAFDKAFSDKAAFPNAAFPKAAFPKAAFEKAAFGRKL